MLIGLASVRPAFGQFKDERTFGDLRYHCQLAAQILANGRQGPNYDWALDQIRQCDASGPEALSTVWRRGIDSTNADALYWSSRFLQDRRLVDAVTSVFADRSRSTVDRLNALRTIAAFIDPKAFVESVDSLPDTPVQPCRITADKATTYLGDQLPDWESPNRLMTLLKTIGETDPPSRVRRNAVCVWNELNGRQLKAHLQVDETSADYAERESVYARHNCRLIAKWLAEGRDSSGYKGAVRQLGSCEITGPSRLARLWNEAPTDTAELTVLYWSSRELWDAELLEAVRAAAADTGRPLVVRLNAIRTLASYGAISAYVTSIDNFPADLAPFRACVSSTSHARQTASDNPPPTGSRELLVPLLQKLADADAEPRVRTAARCVLDHISYRLRPGD